MGNRRALDGWGLGSPERTEFPDGMEFPEEAEVPEGDGGSGRGLSCREGWGCRKEIGGLDGDRGG